MRLQRVLGGLQTEIDRAIEEKLALYTLRDVIESVEDQTAAV